MKEKLKETIVKNLDENVDYIKQIFKDNSDIVYRNFFIGNIKAYLIYIDGMADKKLLDDYVLESLMLQKNNIKSAQDIKDNILTVTDIVIQDKMNDAIDSMISGDTILFIDSLDEAYIVATKSWPVRSVSEPSSETVVRGSRDGFTETIRFNTALVRRRVRDSRLKVIAKKVGVRSKTDLALMYIEDIVNNDVLEQVNEKIDGIKIDAILDSGYIEQLIEQSKFSLFPTVKYTERPDVVAASLYEGRVAILVDNSPAAIIVPTTLPSLFQSPDDYYQRWIYSSAVRIIRLFSIIISLILPSMYVAVTAYHSSIIPSKLAYFIAAAREGVPFPAAVEAIIMEISLALLMESVVRLPKAIGSTIGIVGGLIIGQAAVSAGIVSPVMIIVVSITAITSFTAPNYAITLAFRIIRFLLIIVTSILGLYGLVLGLVMLLIHLVKLKSFGIPYLAPVVNPHIKDFKDMYVRLPMSLFKQRPEYMDTKDKIRQK